MINSTAQFSNEAQYALFTLMDPNWKAQSFRLEKSRWTRQADEIPI